ncbi:MAG TPA: DUF5010 domain-containing protein [Limnochordia bacterium]
MSALLVMLGILVALSTTFRVAAAERLLGAAAPGPYAGKDRAAYAAVSSFHLDDRLVGTYYFYWYDTHSGAHLVDPDGTDALQDHPATMAGFSWREVAWHERELRDMAAAGIDFVLPVYWGSHQEGEWAYGGLEVLVAALERLERTKIAAPKVGMFFDTSALQQVAGGPIDLTTDWGKRTFYRMIRDFYSAIPPRFWAAIDRRPIVFLYSAAFAARYDASLLEYVKASFRADFGGLEPYVVAEVSWQLPADARYRWGAALSGPALLDVVSVGPGYNDSAVPGRTTPIRDREGGRFYRLAWSRALAWLARVQTQPQIIVVETWNEFHEGTDIASSREYGRQYIEMTAAFVERFKAGRMIAPPPGPYTGASEVSIRLGARNDARGLVQVEHEDGRTTPAEAGGETGRRPVPTRFGGMYIYFQVDDSFLADAAGAAVDVTVRYYDERPGWIRIDYDSTDPRATLQGAYKPTRAVPLSGDGSWHETTFHLPDPFSANRQNAAADLRLAMPHEGVIIASVHIRRSH